MPFGPPFSLLTPVFSPPHRIRWEKEVAFIREVNRPTPPKPVKPQEPAEKVIKKVRIGD